MYVESDVCVLIDSFKPDKQTSADGEAEQWSYFFVCKVKLEQENERLRYKLHHSGHVFLGSETLERLRNSQSDAVAATTVRLLRSLVPFPVSIPILCRAAIGYRRQEFQGPFTPKPGN